MLRPDQALDVVSAAGGVGLWEIDLSTGKARWNATLRGLLGVGPEHPASFTSWLEFVPPEDRPLVEAHYLHHLLDRDLLCPVVATDGTIRHLLIRGHELDSGVESVVLGTAVDVTAVVAAQGHVSTSLVAADEAYIVSDAAGLITHVNVRAKDWLAHASQRVVGQPLEAILDEQGAIIAAVRRTATKGAPEQAELRSAEFDGWVEVRTAPLDDGGAALFVRDVSDRKRLERERENILAAEREAHARAQAARDELERREAIDALTGLKSRSAVERAALQLDETGGHLIAIDVDGFGRINEAGGWAGGDDILCEVAERVQGALGRGEAVGRRAGDTFLVVTDERDEDRVGQLAQDLASVMQPPFELLGHAERLSVSIGIAAVDDEQDPWDALHGADAVVRRCKALGGGRILWYDKEHRAEAMQRQRLAGELRQALDRGQFVLHFQPIFGTDNGRYAGCEALLRWEHPARGLVQPETFLDGAGQIGIRHDIERWALDSAIAQMGRWIRERDQQRRRWTPPVLWVNVSQTEMQRPGFAEHVLATLRDAGVDASRLGIEFVPQHGLTLGDDAGAIVRLHDAGVRIGIDDIGAGSADIASLRGLPLDVVKVDGRLTATLGSGRGRSLLDAVVQLARALDAEVLAEAVERPDQLETARDAGCELASGFLLGRPVPHHELSEAVGEGLLVLRGPTSPVSASKRPWWQVSRRDRAHSLDANPVEDELAGNERDGTTGLGTRQAALVAIHHHLEEGRRPVLLLVELDGFEAASLVRGPTATSALLRAEARRLHGIPGARAFRFDDGRFALVLSDTRRGPTSSQVDLVELASGPKGMTACVGIAHATRHTTNAQELEGRARLALEAAQRRGNGSVNDSVSAEQPVRSATAAQVRALHGVLREGYLRVHYQPILSLDDGSLVGFQALARPQLEHGLTGPIEAFDVAESIGLVAELDAVCRSSVFDDGPGFDLPSQSKLFVTVEPQALGHHSLRSGRLLHQVRAGGLTPEQVVLQLREHPAVPADVLREEVHWLKDRGFELALADAGGTHSGLSALAGGGFDHLKFATSLLADARSDDGAAAMVEALCAFAEHSDIHVIATGIETPRLLTMARRLREQGDGPPRIHAVQGYHLGKPRPQPRFDDPIDPRLKKGGWAWQSLA